jgi:hypothetical protein
MPTLPKVLFGRVDHLEGNDFETTLLEAGNNFTDESALDTVGL